MNIKLRNILLTLLRICLESLSKVIFGWKYWGVQATPLPPITDLLLKDSATSLAQKIRSRKVSCEEIIKVFISRIKEVNPILNAVVDFNFTEALEESIRVDNYLSSTKLSELEIAESKPFLGVPFTAKDCFSVKGLRQTSGSYARRNLVAEVDAEPVRLMKDAGAIIIGVTNVAELCMWWETTNTVYGQTNNPFDTRRTAGGSSGGEGSIISSCGSPMGIGTDIGGSIRIPSFFNGVYGHKPTTGIVSNDGQEPVAVGEQQKFLVTGPICRFATDLTPMYKVLAGPNVRLLSLDKKVDFRKIKIYYMLNDGGDPMVTPVEEEITVAEQKVLEYFETAYGIKPIQLHIKEFRKSVEIFLTKLEGEPEAKSFASILAQNKGEINVWTEFAKLLFGASRHTYAALYLATFEKLCGEKGKPLSDYKSDLLQSLKKLEEEFLSTLGDDGIFLYPTHPTTAPHHSQTYFRPFNCGYTAIFNIIGVPVTQCPLGLNLKKLPLGIQIMANKYNDHLCLAAAEELEKMFGGWACPSRVQL